MGERARRETSTRVPAQTAAKNKRIDKTKLIYSHIAMGNDRDLDKAFKALGDKTRRSILSMLHDGTEETATTFFDAFDSAQPTISKHIKALENAKLISRRVEGRQHYFQANPLMLNVLSEWVHRHQLLWTGSLDRLEGYLDQPNE